MKNEKFYINIAYYREKDWERFKETVDDRDKIEDTWSEWYKSYMKLKQHLVKKGFTVYDITINIDELINNKAESKYCV